MLESKIQSALIKRLEAAGCYVIKLSVTNKNGIADVLCIKPNGSIEFYEVKQKGKDLAPLQKFRAEELRAFGIKTFKHDGEDTEV